MELMKDSFNELGKMFQNSMDSFGERLSQQFTEFRESLEFDYEDEELEEFQETEETVLNEEAGDNDFLDSFSLNDEDHLDLKLGCLWAS